MPPSAARRWSASFRKEFEWLFYESMATVLGFLGMTAYIVCVIALAAAITWLVVKISPTSAGEKPPAKSSDS